VSSPNEQTVFLFYKKRNDSLRQVTCCASFLRFMMEERKKLAARSKIAHGELIDFLDS